MSEIIQTSFTKVPNAFLNTLSKYTLPAYETRLLYQILRQTLGWNKLGYYTSLRNLGELCAMDYRHVGRTLKALEARRIIATRKAKRNTHIELNLSYFEWFLKEPPGLILEKAMSQKAINTIASCPEVLSPEEATTVDNSENPCSPQEATTSVASRGDKKIQWRGNYDE